MAYIVEDLRECAAFIQTGGLVAFPTETVYGLGANALSDSAVRSIFTAKRRPLNDPVIVHVAGLASALELIAETDPEIVQIYKFLGNRFWPGPLTLVCTAAPHVPSVLMAGTGRVGVRCPNHPVALALITQAGVPIAAPSANLFSHVSPTTPEHVLKDFSSSEIPIKVLPGGNCSFGIESTVAKLYKEEGQCRIQILRKGGISQEALVSAVSKLDIEIHISSLSRDHRISETESAEGPGMMLKHYSPAIDTYIVSASHQGSDRLCSLSQTAVIDFKNTLKSLSGRYKTDLSETGSVIEAIHNLYAALRWTEELEGVVCVLLPDLRTIEQTEFVSALWDRVFRSAAGREVVCLGEDVYKAE